jgi:ABC-type sugar transport system ATPase subunit
VKQGEFIVFVGPSGCGKSTLLRMIAGLENVSAGAIHIEGRDVTHVEPAHREVAMVFQSYALYPHMSVYDNMAAKWQWFFRAMRFIHTCRFTTIWPSAFA